MIFPFACAADDGYLPFSLCFQKADGFGLVVRFLVFYLMKSLVFAAALVCGASVSRYAFGFGDLKLLGTVVLFGGIGLAVDCLIYGVLLAGWICFVLLLLGRLGRRDKLPLAPFFLLGYICALLFGSFWP